MKRIIMIIMFILLVGSVSAAVNDATAYHRLDDDDLGGGTYTDASGNGKDGIVNGGTTGYTPAVINEGYDNSGTQAAINLSSGTGITGTTWAISVWVYLDSCAGASRYFYDQDDTVRVAIGCRLTTNEFLTYSTAGGGFNYYHTIPAGQWSHIVLNANGATWKAWHNGHNLYNATQASLILDAGDVCIGSYHECVGGAAASWDGKIDEFAFYDHELTPAEIATLYNGGSGYDPYGGAPQNPSVRINAYDIFDNSSINNFTVTLNNGTDFATTNGTVYLNVSIGNYSYNATYSNYFNVTNGETFEAAANDTTYTKQVETWQSEISFNSYELITGNLLPATTYSVNSSSGTTFLLSEALNYEVLTENAGYFNKTQLFNVSALDNLTINITGVYSSVLNISAENAYTTNPIINFSGWVYHPASSENRSYSTTSGFYLMDMIPGNFTVYAEADGYSKSDDNFQNVTISSEAQNLTFSLYSNNSIMIYIRNENTGLFITDNITITVTGVNETQYYTSTGSYFVENLTDGNYSIKFSGDNYTLRTYTVTVADRSTQILNAYLVANSVTVIMAYIDDGNGATLEGVSASMSRLIGGVWTVVQSKESDITGRIQFSYLPDVKYRFTSTFSGYDTKIFYLDPVIFDSYNVLMSKDTTITNIPDFQGISITFTPKTYYNDQLNNFSFTINSPDGVLSSYSYNISFPTSGFYSGSGSNAYGSTFSQILNISGAGYYDSVIIEFTYDTTIGTQKTHRYIYPINNPTPGNGTIIQNLTEDYDLGIFERIFVTVIVVIIVTGILSLLGGILLGAPVGLLLMGYFAYIGFMPLWAALPSLLVGIILLMSRSS